MIKAKRYIDSTLKFLYRNQVIDLPKVWYKYFRDLKELKKTQYDNEFIISPDYPCLADNTNTSGEFGRYVYQDSWAFKHVLSRKPKKLPTLQLPEIDSIEDLNRCDIDDFVLIDYDPHPSIKARMAV